MAIPFVSIELDKVYNLRFGMREQVEFEQLAGMTCAEIEDNAGITTFAKILWAMVRRDNKDITFAEVLDLVDNYAPSESYVMEKVTEAMEAAFPDNAGKNTMPPKVK